VGWVARDPLVRDNIVLFVSDNSLLALSPRTGERLAKYDLSIPRNAELSNLSPWGEGLVASYLSDTESGLVLVPRIRSTRSESRSLGHEAGELDVTRDERIVVHGRARTGNGTILTVLEVTPESIGVRESTGADDVTDISELFQAGSRLLGLAQGSVLMSTVPPAVSAFTPTSPAGLEQQWRTRRYYAGREVKAWAPSNLQAPGSVAVTGSGLEGVVGYEPTSGEILYHFELEEGALVRGIAAGPERLYLLISTATGGQARLVALVTPGR
jgi:hypothetical protein